MDDFENFRKELLDDFQKWVKGFTLPGSRGRYAIDDLESIDPLKSKDQLICLSGDVTHACYKAANYDSPLLIDKAKKIRAEMKNVLEEIPGQLKAIERLKKYISKFPIRSINGFTNALRNMEDDNPFKKALLDLGKQISPNDFLQTILSIFEKGLNYEKETVEIKSQEPLIFRMVAGYLHYPEPLNKREQGANTAENTLLFELTSLFQNFTNPNFNENWPYSNEGPLPELGDPCYEHIANLANAVFYEDEDPNNEEKEFTARKVGDRIRDLRQKKVQFHPEITPPTDVGY